MFVESLSLSLSLSILYIYIYIYTEMTNPRKNCAEEYQSPGSQNSLEANDDEKVIVVDV